jgi:hypothetical protein
MKNNPKKQAKLDLLKDLRKMAMGMISDGAGEDMPEQMQKVMVAAKDKEGLEEGLEKAQEIVGGEDESEEGEMSEMEDESEEESPETIQAKIEELKAKLAKVSK